MEVTRENKEMRAGLMSLIIKIKKKGIRGTILAIIKRIAEIINVAAYYCCWIFQVNERLIVFESEGDLSDNSYALYEFMKSEGYLQSYKAIWLVEDVRACRKNSFENTVFVEKTPRGFAIKRSYYFATCAWYIYDHSNCMWNLKKRKKYKRVYLCHGFAGYKAPKGHRRNNKDDYITVTGEIPKQVLPLYRIIDKNTAILSLGFPRNDYLFNAKEKQSRCLLASFGITNYKKLFLWMPTFRKSYGEGISETYQNSETELPLLETIAQVVKFNHYLEEINDYVILKIHHLQLELPIFKEKFSNIFFVSDNDINNFGLQLYEFIPCFDALITDYSSISADYLLLNKPMVFILDDYKAYQRSRGIIPENALELMTGDHVFTYEQLLESITEIHNGKDRFQKERQELMPKFHKYTDGMARNRILDYFKIGK